MKKHVSASGLIAILLAVSLVSGCATATWQRPAVASYDATGKVLAQLHQTAKQLKATGKLGPGEIAQFNEMYGMAVGIYKGIGDTLALAIEVEDSATHDRLMADVQTLTEKLAVLVTGLAKLVQEVS